MKDDNDEYPETHPLDDLGVPPMTFRIYEIEHSGDESHAVSELRRLGCEDVKVIHRDYEGEESIRVTCYLPDPTLWEFERRVARESDLCL
jgi:hypothetical protein